MSRLTRRTFLGFSVGGFLAALGLRRNPTLQDYVTTVSPDTVRGETLVTSWRNGTVTLKKSVPVTFRGKWIPFEPESRG